MKKISFLICCILFINTGCKAQGLLDQVKTSNCLIKGFTSPYTLKAASIYNDIDGQLIMNLYADSIEGAGHIVTIIASKNEWLRLNCECLSEGTFAWIKGGSVGTATRNYNDEPIFLYQKPNKESNVVGELHGQQIVLIYGGSENWAYVKGKGKNGKEVEGWLEPEMQCPSPYTTCPTPEY